MQFSQSLARRLQRPSHANVRSTTAMDISAIAPSFPSNALAWAWASSHAGWALRSKTLTAPVNAIGLLRPSALSPDFFHPSLGKYRFQIPGQSRPIQKKLLETETNPVKRQTLQRLLAEEEAKLAPALANKTTKESNT